MMLLKTIMVFGTTILTVIFFTPLGLISFILSIVGLKKQMSWMIYRIAQVWGRFIIFVAGCTMEVEGTENVPKSGGLCFVSNHVGYFDIVLLIAYAGRPFGFIAKKELAFLPLFNMWIYILGGLFIDRKSLRNALNTINRGVKRIQNGESMLIFPEGTRSKDRGLLPFKSGALKLATNALSPIVPIAISGSYEVFEKNMLVNKAHVRITFCPPINTAEMSAEDRRTKLSDKVHSTIGAALDKPSLTAPSNNENGD